MDDISIKVITGLIVSIIALVITQLITLLRDYIKQNRIYLTELYLPLYNDLIKCYYTLSTLPSEYELTETISSQQMMNKIKKLFADKIDRCNLSITKFIITNTHNTMYKKTMETHISFEDFFWITFYINSFIDISVKSILHDKGIKKSLKIYKRFFDFLYQVSALYNDRELTLSIASLYWFITLENIDFRKLYKKSICKNDFITYIITNTSKDKTEMVYESLCKYYE